MRFNNPIPRSGLPLFHESSPQRSARDSDATQRLWQKHRDAGKQAQANALAIDKLQQDVNRLRIRKGAPESSSSLPFKIKRGSSWLKFKIGTGWFKPNGATIVPTDVETEITITSGVEEYWFWLELTNTTATVSHSATEPEWTINRVPIGWVDTLTHVSESRSLVRQFLRGHVYIPCL